MSKDLVVYYSRADENYVNGTLKNLEVGNTEVCAKEIVSLTGADEFKIEQLVPYSKSYNECIEEARSDQRSKKRVEIKNFPDSIEEYETIYLGYPNYWSTMPMAVFTFLEHFDFTGKKIRPFCTHEGSGMGSSKRDIENFARGAVVEDGLSLQGAKVSTEKSKTEIEKWVGEK